MNGLLLVDKPSGMTSHDVVSVARRLLQTKEVGHSGTLDPMASGLMVLLVGEATKLSAYVTEGDKSYEVGVKLGITTDTLDTTGKILSEKAVSCSEEQLQKMSLGLVGELSLPIPMFSAKKINGQKLYELAHQGISIETPQKIMKFWNVETRNQPNDQTGDPSFHLHCSKGSFIRSWVSLLGEKLGCGAAMSSLRRTSSHRFSIREAISFESLALVPPEKKSSLLIPLDQALGEIKSIRVHGQDENLLRNGQISHSLRSQLITLFNPEQDSLVQILPEKRGSILALIGLEKGQGFKIRRVFNY